MKFWYLLLSFFLLSPILSSIAQNGLEGSERSFLDSLSYMKPAKDLFNLIAEQGYTHSTAITSAAASVMAVKDAITSEAEKNEMKNAIIEMKKDIIEMKKDIIEMKKDIKDVKKDIGEIQTFLAGFTFVPSTSVLEASGIQTPITFRPSQFETPPTQTPTTVPTSQFEASSTQTPITFPPSEETPKVVFVYSKIWKDSSSHSPTSRDVGTGQPEYKRKIVYRLFRESCDYSCQEESLSKKEFDSVGACCRSEMDDSRVSGICSGVHAICMKDHFVIKYTD